MYIRLFTLSYVFFSHTFQYKLMMLQLYKVRRMTPLKMSMLVRAPFLTNRWEESVPTRLDYWPSFQIVGLRF